MTYRIALNFEDGVTRFIDCNAGEKVLDAAFRQAINLPMDCSDGVCGTCKCRCESGAYDLGEDYLDEALGADEVEQRQVLTCQMVPESDCVLAVPVASSTCKTGTMRFDATLGAITTHADAALEVHFELDQTLAFLPGQYVNIAVPGSEQTRSYSFSSLPGSGQASFLIKQVAGGLMSGWLGRAQPGERVSMTGPLGSFYLRAVTRPLLFLAGGTGLAPFLSMLEVLAERNEQQSISLIYGVSRDQDLVMLEALQGFCARLPNFSFVTCVGDPRTRHPRQGYVTQHLAPGVLNEGDVDVYLCGPPPMVDAVRQHFKAMGLTPFSFHYEKFTANNIVIGDVA
ncbi:benzoate 1,2-dioxygenase electron transfer component BenC [Pseudomonas sp. FEN]|uniref:benzoate 1,2-dioxygenase electron transfer component BenC n=1 Tax=Pseudomonas sp. FEN TaxID=2767468 RepID=UPI0017482B93|nr:benzoate 1,2-dioxygenase electron transfer component BenC [Pseudomonas sp. FEN]